MKKRILFAIGNQRVTLVNVANVEESAKQQRFLRDVHAESQQQRAAFNACMMRPKMPELPS